MTTTNYNDLALLCKILATRNELHSMRHSARFKFIRLDRIYGKRKKIMQTCSVHDHFSSIEHIRCLVRDPLPKKWLKVSISKIKRLRQYALAQRELTKAEVMSYTQETRKEMCRLLKKNGWRLHFDQSNFATCILSNDSERRTILESKEEIAFIAAEGILLGELE